MTHAVDISGDHICVVTPRPPHASDNRACGEMGRYLFGRLGRISGPVRLTVCCPDSEVPLTDAAAGVVQALERGVLWAEQVYEIRTVRKLSHPIAPEVAWAEPTPESGVPASRSPKSPTTARPVEIRVLGCAVPADWTTPTLPRA